MLDEFPALGRLDFFESALAFMAGYGIKSFFDRAIAQTRSRKLTAPTIRCWTIATSASPSHHDERTAKRVSDALGTWRDELAGFHHYAGPPAVAWLGHLNGIAKGDGRGVY